MDMKKRILLSMILLALCLIQASADNYYYRIRLYDEEGKLGDWSDYITVTSEVKNYGLQNEYYVYHHGLRDLINGETVSDGHENYSLLQKNVVNLDKIYGIAFANEKGRTISDYQNIMLGDEYEAWKDIRSHIKYLDLHYYIRDTYTDDSYFMDMHNVEELELPKDGMTVGNGDIDCRRYFANADKLKKNNYRLRRYNR